MLLAPESHRRLEEFFRQHLRDESLRLPRVRFYAGRFAGLLTRTFGIGAITFGSRVFVSPEFLRRGADDRLALPAGLAVHEATHVLQYARVGFVPFLSLYLRDYARALGREAGRARERHRAAYLAISFEVEARAAEDGYDAWRGRV
ncbi:MAG TPA: DUF4157 domain-containing protein [Pyrinomonadaceae bacterium]|jgi:hypothetical protein|nr:DUF4157 domain-containing protein [Pyrinomonadaceae bacterium]